MSELRQKSLVCEDVLPFLQDVDRCSEAAQIRDSDGWVALVLGSVVLVGDLLPKAPDAQRHMTALRTQHPFLYARLLAGPMVALASGMVMLRGFNWARWLFVLWFGYNLIGNIAHSPRRLLAPNLLAGSVFGAAVYLLFRPAATAFFRG